MRWVTPSSRPAPKAQPGKPSVRAAPPAPASPPGSDIVERIVLYVPTEVVAVFTMLLTAAVSLKVDPKQLPLIGAGLIVIFLIITVVYIFRSAPTGSIRNAHLLVSPVAYLAWAYPISSSILGTWFVPIFAFLLQAIVLALSIFIKPQ